MNLKTNIIFWLSFSYILFYSLTFWLVGYEATAYIIAALLFGLSFMVLATWGLTGVRAFREGGREGEAVLAFSICVIAAYGLYTRIWSVFRISLHNPEWMQTSPVGLGAAVLLLIFFTGALLAPETREGNVPTKNYIWWAIAVFIAGCSLGVGIGVAISRDVGPIPKAEVMSSPMSTVPALTCGDPKPILVRSFCRARPNMTVMQ